MKKAAKHGYIEAYGCNSDRLVLFILEEQTKTLSPCIPKYMPGLEPFCTHMASAVKFCCHQTW